LAPSLGRTSSAPRSCSSSSIAKARRHGLRHRLVPDRAVDIPEAGQHAALLGPVRDLLQQVQRAAITSDGRGGVAEPVASVAEMIQGVGFAEQVAERAPSAPP
jgi:hypothetical protein